ncbi:hypothetical protein [Clostridium beijerinckii]
MSQNSSNIVLFNHSLQRRNCKIRSTHKYYIHYIILLSVFIFLKPLYL